MFQISQDESVAYRDDNKELSVSELKLLNKKYQKEIEILRLNLQQRDKTIATLNNKVELLRGNPVSSAIFEKGINFIVSKLNNVGSNISDSKDESEDQPNSKVSKAGIKVSREGYVSCLFCIQCLLLVLFKNLTDNQNIKYGIQ